MPGLIFLFFPLRCQTCSPPGLPGRDVHPPTIPKKEDLALSLEFLLLRGGPVLSHKYQQVWVELEVEKGVGEPMEETCGTPQHHWSQALPPRPHSTRGLLPPPCSFSLSFPQERGPGPGPHFSVPPQGQSEQTYSTVKTGAPAVTVTNLKPATRYVFQIRAASPGPSWETQSFNPRIEVQTPEEGKWCVPLERDRAERTQHGPGQGDKWGGGLSVQLKGACRTV